MQTCPDVFSSICPCELWFRGPYLKCSNVNNLTEIVRRLESADATIHRLELRGLTDRRLDERAFGSVPIRQIDVSNTQSLEEVRHESLLLYGALCRSRRAHSRDNLARLRSLLYPILRLRLFRSLRRYRYLAASTLSAFFSIVTFQMTLVTATTATCPISRRIHLPTRKC